MTDVLEILHRLLNGLVSTAITLIGLVVVLIYCVVWTNLYIGQPLLVPPLGAGFAPLLLGLLLCWPMLHVLFSARSVGGAKFAWFVLMLLFSWLAYLPFLIITQSKVTKLSQ